MIQLLINISGGVHMNNSKLPHLIIGIICLLYVVSPDPIPLAVDDVLVGLLGVRSFIKMKDDQPKLHD